MAASRRVGYGHRQSSVESFWLSTMKATEVYNRSTMPLCKISFTVVAATILWGASAFAQSATCDETLWSHVYNPSRLVVQEKCVTVTGTVVDATARQSTHRKDGVRHEGDGDTHGWLKLDPGQEKFLNSGNKTNEGGNLVFETICMFPVTQADAKAACKGFHSGVTIPPVGSHVSITGTWVQDMEHAKWFEIHPVTSTVVGK